MNRILFVVVVVLSLISATGIAGLGKSKTPISPIAVQAQPASGIRVLDVMSEWKLRSSLIATNYKSEWIEYRTVSVQEVCGEIFVISVPKKNVLPKLPIVVECRKSLKIYSLKMVLDANKEKNGAIAIDHIEVVTDLTPYRDATKEHVFQIGRLNISGPNGPTPYMVVKFLHVPEETLRARIFELISPSVDDWDFGLK